MPSSPHKTVAAPLAQKTGRSAVWQLIGGGWQTIVRLGASVFLARALTPEDFGLFGLALLAQGLVTNAGALNMSLGIIAKKDITEDDICTCFWTVASTRLCMFLICYLGAPLAAVFFENPRVAGVLRVVSVTFLISILEAVSETLLIKDLRFGVLNAVRGGAALLESMLAVVLALYTNLGYWVLVIAMLASTALRSALVFGWARWMPKFRFSRDSFKYLFRFGINGLGSSIVRYFNQNIDYISVGRLLGAGELGLYEFAYKVPHLLYQRVSAPVASVIFPSLSKLQGSDVEMAKACEKTIKHVTLIVFPALFCLAAVADVAVPVLWGGQWGAIIVPMRILCLCAALRCIPLGAGAILYCKDRPDLPFKIGLCGLIWTALCVGILGYEWGIRGVASGMVFSALPDLCTLWLAYRMLKVSMKGVFSAIAPVAAASTGCAGAAYVTKLACVFLNFPSIGTLAASVMAGAVVYPLAVYLFFPALFLEILETFQTVSGQEAPGILLRLANRRICRATPC